MKKLGNYILLNPKENISKGKIARKIAMENLKPFTRDINTWSNISFNGGSKFRNGDTLLARITPCLENGKTAFVNILGDDEIAYGSTEFYVLRAVKNKMDPYYLYYLTISKKFRNTMIKAMTGTSGRQRVPKEAVLEYLMDVPDFESQKKIGEKLKVIDDKITLNNQINDNLISLATALFNKYFPNINSGNEMIGNFISNYDRLRKPLSKKERLSIPGKYRYIGATSVNDYINKYNFDGIYLLLGEDGTVEDANGYPILQYISGKFWPNNHAHVLQGKNVSTEWLYLFFKQRKITSIVTGAVQKKISQKNLNSLSISIPDKDKLARFDTIINPIFKNIRIIESENHSLEKIKIELLSKLF